LPTSAQPPRYRAYLLRFWSERNQHPALATVWRFSLEDPHTGQRQGFPSLEALVEALRKELGSLENDSEQ
jgi:hypothetical protein